jgi:hypothetical protein
MEDGRAGIRPRLLDTQGQSPQAATAKKSRRLLPMNQSPDFQQLLAGLASQTPILVVCAVGMVVALLKWPQAPHASRWILLGFLLGELVSLLAPVVQHFSIDWLRGQPPGQRLTINAAIGFGWATLRGVSMILLLVGAYAGRNRWAGSGGVPPYPPAQPPGVPGMPPPPGFG